MQKITAETTFSTHLIDSIKNEAEIAMRAGIFPGCVIGLIKPNANNGRDIDDVFDSLILSYGSATYGHSLLLGQYSVYDIASITKTFTAMLALKLVNDGKISLDTKIASILPLEGEYIEDITLYHLLTFTIEFNLREGIDVLWNMPTEKILKTIFTVGLREAPGTHHQYRNSTTLLLGLVIETVAEKPLDIFMKEVIFEPFGMHYTTYHPSDFCLWKDAIVPTEYDEKFRKRLIVGEVHDELSWKFYQDNKRCTGVAGVFSTPNDLVQFAKAVLRGCQIGGYKLYPNGFQDERNIGIQMQKDQLTHLPGHRFGFGWDKFFPEYSHCRCFTENAIVATGFTGCSVTLHTEKKLGIVICTNVVHPKRRTDKAMKEFRQRIANLVVYCKHCDE